MLACLVIFHALETATIEVNGKEYTDPELWGNLELPYI